jgi:hypothetical protein
MKKVKNTLQIIALVSVFAGVILTTICACMAQ